MAPGGGVAIGGNDAGEKVGLDIGDDSLVFLDEVAPSAQEVGEGTGLQIPRIEPGQIEPDLEIAEIGRGESASTGVQTTRQQGLLLEGQLQIAGVGPGPRVV